MAWALGFANQACHSASDKFLFHLLLAEQILFYRLPS